MTAKVSSLIAPISVAEPHLSITLGCFAPARQSLNVHGLKAAEQPGGMKIDVSSFSAETQRSSITAFSILRPAGI